ncbi:MAG: hypothetical protein ACI4KA_04160 [Oscillospiraceae bacterium]
MTKNSKLSLFAAIPAFIALFVIRLLLVTGGTDMETGFLYDENGFLINFSYYGLLIITFVAMTALGILDRKNKSYYHTADISQVVDIKAVMLGFPLLIAGALTIYEGYMQTQALTPSAYLMFVSFILGTAMTIIAFIILYKKEFSPALGFSLVVPALYYTLRGIGVFLDRMAITTIPEYLIESLSYIGTALFFMQLAKLLSGNESKTTRTAVSVFGLTTGLMILSSAFAVIGADIFSEAGERICANAVIAEIEQQKLLSRYTLGYHMAYTSWVDVAMALAMILTVIAMNIPAKPAGNDDTDTDTPETPEANDTPEAPENENA